MFREISRSKFRNLGLGMRNFAQNSEEIGQKTTNFCREGIRANSRRCGTGIKCHSALNKEARPAGSRPALRGPTCRAGG